MFEMYFEYGKLPKLSFSLYRIIQPPLYFLTCVTPKGNTLPKRRHLRLFGYDLVVVKYWEWDRIKGDEGKSVQRSWT